MNKIWSFLQDDNSRAVLAWIGSGVVVVVGGIWAVVKVFLSKGQGKTTPAPTVTAAHGGVAAGRDMQNNTINIRSAPKR